MEVRGREAGDGGHLGTVAASLTSFNPGLSYSDVVCALIWRSTGFELRVLGAGVVEV